MYRAKKSFATKDYNVHGKQKLEEDFTTQDEIDEFLDIEYIEPYDGSISITQNGSYNVEEYDTAEVNVSGGGGTDTSDATATASDIVRNKTAYARGEKLTGTYDGIIPTGTTQINTNGTYNISQYASAEVSVPGIIPTGTISITENGTVDVTNYASANVNVSGNYEVPDGVKFGFISYIPSDLDFSKTTDFSTMFKQATFTTFDVIDTSSGTNFNRTFSYCSALVTLPQINTSKGSIFNGFLEGCSQIQNIPILNFSEMTNNSSTFDGCNSLTDESLNNILYSISQGTKLASDSWKTLKRMGISSAQATRCQSLTYYQAFINAGWTTGY